MNSGSLFLRLVTLLILSIGYIIVTPFLIKLLNIEILPLSRRPFIILLGCLTSFLIINYHLAHNGNNVKDPLTEGLIFLFYAILIISFLGPEVFVVFAGEEKRYFLKKVTLYRQLDELRYLLFLEIPVGWGLYKRLKKYS